MSGNNSTVNNNGNAAVSQFTSLSGHIIRSASLPEIAKFMKELWRYELEFKSKLPEIPPLKVLRYKISIEHQLVDNLVLMGKSDKLELDSEAENLRDGHIE